MKDSEDRLLEVCCEIVSRHEKRWKSLAWMLAAQAIVNIIFACAIRGII